MAKTLPSQSGGLGSIPGQGIRSQMTQRKSLHAATKMKDPECYN